MSADFKMKFSPFIPNKIALDFEFNSPYGQVGRWLSSRGRLMVAGAKAQVGVQSGRLRNSIHYRVDRNPLGVILRVESTGVHYAYDHHEGVRPHIITPNDANILRFSSGGRVIYTRKVEHPGQRPNKFLSDQLYLARV